MYIFVSKGFSLSVDAYSLLFKSNECREIFSDKCKKRQKVITFVKLLFKNTYFYIVALKKVIEKYKN